jgi:hypothetical protein
MGLEYFVSSPINLWISQPYIISYLEKIYLGRDKALPNTLFYPYKCLDCPFSKLKKQALINIVKRHRGIFGWFLEDRRLYHDLGGVFLARDVQVPPVVTPTRSRTRGVRFLSGSKSRGPDGRRLFFEQGTWVTWKREELLRVLPEPVTGHFPLTYSVIILI